MEIDLLCQFFDQLTVTEVYLLPPEDEELLCRLFDSLSFSDDGFMMPMSYISSTIGFQEELREGPGHGPDGLSFFTWSKGSGLYWCIFQAHFWFQGYPAKVMLLGRQLKRDFFLISYVVVRKKNDWLAFGFFEDDQRWSSSLFYILWRYRKSDQPPTSASVSQPPVFSHVHGGGWYRFFISVPFISFHVCSNFIFSFLISWYPMLRYRTLGKDYWFYILWRCKTFGKDHCRLLRRYISSSPPRQQQAQPPSSVSCNILRHGKFLRRVLCLPTRDDRVVIGVFYLRRVLCLPTRDNKCFMHGTAPVWMVWFVCDPSSPMVYNRTRSLLCPLNVRLFLWKVGEAGGIPAFASLHVRRSLQQFSHRRQLKSRTRGSRYCNNVNQCVNGFSRQPRKLYRECLATIVCVLRFKVCSKIRYKMLWLVEIFAFVLKDVKHSFI